MFGEGNCCAEVVLVGEAPGKSEDESGKPFCGKAGLVLSRLLALAGYQRQQVYIANVLKCRPPKNRNPNPLEIKACSNYLLGQLKIIKPKIICCLGNFALSFIMENFKLAAKIQPVGKIHGRVFIPPGSSLKIIPLYHPASAIYNPGIISVLEKDFTMLKNIP